MKSEEQIRAKIEQIKIDFIEKFANDDTERALFQMVYRTLNWVLKDNQDNIRI